MAMFISYATSRRSEANRLAEVLGAEGIPTFLAHENLVYGQPWPRALATAVDNSEALVVLVCQDSNQSDWVEREVTRAIEIKIPVLPVRLEHVDRGVLPFLLGPTQALEWDGHDRDSLSRLVADLRRVNSQGPNVRRSIRRTAPVSGPGGAGAETAPAGNDPAMPTAAEVPEVDTAKTLNGDKVATVFAAATEKAKSQTDQQLIRSVSTLRNSYDRKLKDLGSKHPSVIQARQRYVAAWVNFMHSILSSLPPVPNTVQLTRPRRILLGQLTRQAKYERFGTQFRTPRPGSRRERRLAALDDQTGADIADMLSNLVEPEDRRKIIVALGSGQTAPIETILRLLPAANLQAVRDC